MQDVPSTAIISLPLSARKLHAGHREYFFVTPATGRRIVEYLANCFKMKLARQRTHHNTFNFFDHQGQIVARAVICRDERTTVDWVRVG